MKLRNGQTYDEPELSLEPFIKDYENWHTDEITFLRIIEKTLDKIKDQWYFIRRWYKTPEEEGLPADTRHSYKIHFYGEEYFTEEVITELIKLHRLAAKHSMFFIQFSDQWTHIPTFTINIKERDK